MKVDKNFTGGNIAVVSKTDSVVKLKNELRDTIGDWFYWAFRVTGAAGKTVTFDFEGETRVGYFGPAISYDLTNWHWLGAQPDRTAFTYTFGDEEDCVYFAHSMLYHPARFESFAAQRGINVKHLCVTPKGRSVPYCEIGDGNIPIVLTSRHHACESSGSYVLEGVLDEYIRHPIPGTRVFCVPFVDFDGVIDGDQGKCRAPHDHNRDYDHAKKPIYHETAAIRQFIDENSVKYMLDFHSPWHFIGRNDKVFVVQCDSEKVPLYQEFGRLLEQSLTKDSLRYRSTDDIAPDTEWNDTSDTLGVHYVGGVGQDGIGFVLETTYFGEADNIFTQESSVELGRCYCRALNEFISKRSK